MQKIALPKPFVFFLLVFLLLCGCSKEPLPEGMPPLHPVELTFLQEGQPLAEAIVKLYPQDTALQRWESGGITDADGKVTMFTLGRYSGAVAGKCKITVSKTDRDPSSFTGELTDARAEEYARAEDARRVYDLVEPKYGNPQTTDLEIEVVSGKNAQQFDVGKAVKEIRRVLAK